MNKSKVFTGEKSKDTGEMLGFTGEKLKIPAKILDLPAKTKIQAKLANKIFKK